MTLKKGQTNNPNGRPSDPQVNQFRIAIRSKQIERLEQAYIELDNLKDIGREKDYLDLYLRLSKEAFPTMPAEIEAGEIERSTLSIFEKVQDMIRQAESKRTEPANMKKIG